MPVVSIFDTKPHDRHFLLEAAAAQKSSDIDIEWRFHDFRLTTETAPLAQGATIVSLFVNDHADRPCLRILKNLGVKVIVLRSAGFNHIDLQAARDFGLIVTRVPAYSPHAVAEHTVALLLTLNRRIHRAYNRVREHNFSLHGLIGFDLHGKTAGIIGTGKIGQLVARILGQGFGMTLLATDPFPDEPWAAQSNVTYLPLEDLLARSHVLSLHAPLTPETRHLLNEQTLAHLQPGTWILNTSRGALIDTAALLKALNSGHVGGAALDVYEEEEGIFFEDLSDSPLADDQLDLLLAHPNVLLTSHQAFLTREALHEIARVTVENIRRSATPTTATGGAGDYLEGTRLV